MPADRTVFLQPGRLGVNFSSHPADLRDGELADSLNWQIGDRGSLEKRRGWSAVGGVDPGNATRVLAATTFRDTLGVNWIAAATDDGGLIASSDGGESWTSITAGLATTYVPSFASFLGKLYYANGVDPLQEWTGATLSALAAAPVGRFLTVWRNRLWVVAGAAAGTERRVWWSGIGNAADWANIATNYVDLVGYGPVTACATAPNVGTEASAGDGVLVFTDRSMHRIIDDSDNIVGSGAASSGGANVLVDGSTGCTNQQTIAQVAGRVYLVGIGGVYSTDGHAQLRLESRNVAPVFRGSLARPEAAVGVAYRDRYYLAFSTATSLSNDRVLELYTDRIVDEHGQHAWMPHGIPVAAWAVYPTPLGPRLYFFDDRAGNGGRLRWMFNGWGDAAGVETLEDITAFARTGASNFGIPQLKRVRRIFLLGRGRINGAVSGDFEETVGEAAVFPLRRTYRVWDTNAKWGDGVWGASAGLTGSPAYYSTRARHVVFELSESSQDPGPTVRAIGATAEQAGGASIEGMNVTLTPLDSY